MSAIVHQASGHIVAMTYAPVPEEGLPAGCVNVEEILHAEPDEYWDGEDGQARTTSALTADRAKVSLGEPVTVTVPENAWLRVDNGFVQAEGTEWTWSSAVPRTAVVQLAGTWMSAMLVLTARADAAWTAKLLEKIDDEAGAVRCRFITEAPGQQLTYSRKEAEARAWVAASEPELGDYPFLAAEVGATGLSAGDAAAAIIAAADQWAQIGAAIEGARIAAKRAVSEAATVTDKIAAAAVDWEAVIGA